MCKYAYFDQASYYLSFSTCSWVGVWTTMGLQVGVVEAAVISFKGVFHVGSEIFNSLSDFITAVEVRIVEGETKLLKSEQKV